MKTKIRLLLKNIPTPAGFEIMIITEGVGNGWTFPADVLRASLGMWNGAECFINHTLENRDIHDLAGIVKNAVWDESASGIRAELTPIGPAAHILLETGKELLSDDALNSHLGFSADLFMTTSGKTVTKIEKVNSVDLVYAPARGGKFIRALNSIVQGDEAMRMLLSKGFFFDPPKGTGGGDDDLDPEPKPAGSTAKTIEPEAITKLQISLCSSVLESNLMASNLPEASQKMIRAQFAGKVFDPADLTKSIDAARELVSELTAPGVVKGIRLSNMANSDDQIRAALSDLFALPRDEGLEKVTPARLTGIRELYHMLSGDYEMMGGYHKDRIQLATTLTFPNLVANVLNKIVTNRWEELGRAGYNWWEKIVSVEHFTSLQQITGILVGTVGSLPVVAEGAEYTELPIGENGEIAVWEKRGGYIPLTLELIDRDETRKLAAYPKELASAALREISALIAGIFTQNSGVGPAMADTDYLFNNTAVTTTGGHKNLLTTALSASEWDVVGTAMYNQPLLISNAAGIRGTGKKMAINPKYCLVPRALQLTAKKILYPTLENASNITSENQQQGQPDDVVTVPEWTDTTDWAAVVDPKIVPGIVLGERFGIKPEVFIAGNELSPAMFSNDEHRLKVRMFTAVLVNDFRPLHKSNV